MAHWLSSKSTKTNIGIQLPAERQRVNIKRRSNQKNQKSGVLYLYSICNYCCIPACWRCAAFRSLSEVCARVRVRVKLGLGLTL